MIVATGSASASSMRDAPGATPPCRRGRDLEQRKHARNEPAPARRNGRAGHRFRELASARAARRGARALDSTPSSRYPCTARLATLLGVKLDDRGLRLRSGCSGRVKLKLRLILARAARRGQKLVRNPAAAPPPTQDDEPTTIGPHWRRLLEPEARPQ